MAKAAHCAQCGANVYVGADGRCPKGHGPESLSNYYDVPDAAAATPAVSVPGAAEASATAPTATRPIGAPVPATPQKKSNALVIVLVILGLLVVCGVGSCCAVGSMLPMLSDEFTTEIERALEEE